MRRAADVSPLVPRFVTRYTDAPGIPVGCVRWCHARGCRTLVVAVDAYQRRKIVEAGSTLRCPSCTRAGAPLYRYRYRWPVIG